MNSPTHFFLAVFRVLKLVKRSAHSSYEEKDNEAEVMGIMAFAGLIGVVSGIIFGGGMAADLSQTSIIFENRDLDFIFLWVLFYVSFHLSANLFLVPLFFIIYKINNLRFGLEKTPRKVQEEFRGAEENFRLFNSIAIHITLARLFSRLFSRWVSSIVKSRKIV